MHKNKLEMELSISSERRYSYADYLTWIDNVRREIFDGIVKLMSPAPARLHQQISTQLMWQLSTFLRQKKCKVYHAPFDVRLPQADVKDNDQIYTVVQPDICVICDISKLDEQGCLGAPDLIIEIVSPSSASRDIKEKFEIYQKSGVREYWIVRPYDKSAEVFLLSDKGKYELRGIYVSGDLVPVSIFNDQLEINLTEVFEE